MHTGVWCFTSERNKKKKEGEMKSDEEEYIGRNATVRYGDPHRDGDSVEF